MKVLCTGGNGFLGQWTCAQLALQGHEPLIFDRRGLSHNQYESFLGDVTDPVAVTEAVAHVDGVIHLAACLGTQETIQNPHPAAMTNIMGSLNVFTACNQYDLPCVYIAVGNWFAQNSYSISKTTAERFAQMFNLYRSGRINIVRAVNAYGPGQSAAAPFGPSKVRKIMPAFVCRALSGMPIEVYGDGSQVSDMVYVEDVARALVFALGENWEKPHSIGCVVPLTVQETAEIVAEATGAEITYLPMRPGEDPSRPVTAESPRVEVFDATPIREGVAKTVEWFRENEGVTWKRPL